MTTHKFNKIDVSTLSMGKIKDGAKMRTFFIDYDKQLFNVQSPQLLLDWGGIPKVDEYHTTDDERRYVLYGTQPQPQSISTLARRPEHRALCGHTPLSCASPTQLGTAFTPGNDRY